MKIFNPVYTFLDTLVKYICKAASFVVILSLSLLVLDLGAGVLLRYVFSYVPAWYEELAKIFLIWIAFAGGIIASNKSEHVSINIFPHSTPKLLRDILDILVQIMILITSFLVVRYGYKFAIGGRIGVFPSMDFLPLYVSYVAVPIGYLGVFIVALRNLFGILSGNNTIVHSPVEALTDNPT